jgi:hypothetical protein
MSEEQDTSGLGSPGSFRASWATRLVGVIRSTQQTDLILAVLCGAVFSISGFVEIKQPGNGFSEKGFYLAGLIALALVVTHFIRSWRLPDTPVTVNVDQNGMSVAGPATTATHQLAIQVARAALQHRGPVPKAQGAMLPGDIKDTKNIRQFSEAESEADHQRTRLLVESQESEITRRIAEAIRMGIAPKLETSAVAADAIKQDAAVLPQARPDAETSNVPQPVGDDHKS